jgi:murein L,D-transpeptidase YcbB/YkuD
MTLRTLRIFGFSAAMLLFSITLSSGEDGVTPTPPDTMPLIQKVSLRIQEQVLLVDKQKGFDCQGEPICGIQQIPLFYAERQFMPAWIDASGLRPMGLDFIRALEWAGQDGLLPEDYHLGAIHAILKEMEAEASLPTGHKADQWARMDLLLTDAFLLLSSHLSGGRVNPETMHKDWIITGNRVDIVAALNGALDESQIEPSLDRLRPTHKGYAGLRQALNQLSAIEQLGGWPSVPAGPTIRPNERNARVPAVRERLEKGGDLAMTEPPQDLELMDTALVASLKKFQARHGLEPDGALGQRTLEELNVTVQERIRQIELNLERWRWLPKQPGERYIAVNIADFSLMVVERQEIALTMRVVVGRPARRTPVFSSPMTYMVISPYWTVPPTIAIEDILPKAIEDPGYFAKESIKVYYGWDEGNAAVDPRQINWRLYSKGNFPFRLVQEPGSENALGHLKFMFPNRFSVYLHDTPNRKLFGKVQRDFSSGCIRVENAVALAEYLLKDSPNWNGEKLRAAIKKNQQQIVTLATAVPVHLLYMTAWLDGNGEVQFRKDIYKRDAQLDLVLKRRQPANPFLMSESIAGSQHASAGGK